MAEPIKSRIIARLLELCQPLKAEGKVREVKRVRTVFLLEPVKPNLHLVIGPEAVIGGKEGDNRGFTMSFPAWFKIIVADGRDNYTLSDQMAAFIQERIEADPQLQELCNIVNYEGDEPFTEKELEPAGGIVVMYEVQYRRYRAGPDRNY